MNDAPKNVDARLFAIGILSVTACVLFVGLVLTLLTPRQALASGQSDRGGDYIMSTQQVSVSLEGVVVVDGASNRMIMYGFDINNHRLDILDGFALERLSRDKSTDTTDDKAPKRKGR